MDVLHLGTYFHTFLSPFPTDSTLFLSSFMLLCFFFFPMFLFIAGVVGASGLSVVNSCTNNWLKWRIALTLR
jgi:hypothetical protein